MKTNKCIFLDRDGTVIEDGEYAVDISKMVLKPDAVASLKKLQNLGYILVIITNQSGVARGYFTEADVQNFNAHLVNLLKENGVNISATYYCPHMKGGVVDKYNVECNCRKPKTGMFLQAAADFNVDLSKSFAIGDKLRDLAICNESACRGFLLDDGKLNQQIYNNQTNFTVVKSLAECVEIIVGDSK